MAEGTQIAVTPDGQDVYVVAGQRQRGVRRSLDRAVAGRHRGRGGGDQIATNATDPTVSPDGRYLAYLHCLPGDNRADEIVLRDLTTGEETVTSGPGGYRSSSTGWSSPRIRATSFVATILRSDDARVHRGSMRSTSSPASRHRAATSGSRPVGRAGSAVRGMTGEYLGVKGTPPSVCISPRWPVAVQRGRCSPFPTTPTQVVSDRSGRHILAVVDHSLYRWSEGEKEPTKIADGVIGAAWIPDGSPPPPPVPASKTMPGSLVAAVDGDRLAFLASANGSEQTSYGTYPGISSVSVTPDGKEILFSYTGPSGACAEPAPEVDRAQHGNACRHAHRRWGGDAESSVRTDGSSPTASPATVPRSA